jgi:hypothetical protein
VAAAVNPQTRATDGAMVLSLPMPYRRQISRQGGLVYKRILSLVFAYLWFPAGQIALQAQEFKLLDRTVQVHGYVSQGFVYTNHNNWLTMDTTDGSGAMTDMALNASSQITDKFRVGAQVFDRNLGQLGQYHPSLDWAFADYRFKPWFGIRGGKVKTTLGLYNDTQDQDFLRVFALLPQSIYPSDLRDTTIAHVGGDIYGAVALKHRLGELFYTAYAGHSTDSAYGGDTYLASKYGVSYKDGGALKYGGDLRWNTPLRGLLIGASRLNQNTTANATSVNPLNPQGGPVSYKTVSKADWTNQFYGEFAAGKLKIDSEYRRFVHDNLAFFGELETIADVRAWYVSGTYRVMKRLAVGSYYSRYAITSVSGGPLAVAAPNQTDTSLPQNHVYDKVISARVDLNRFWNVKAEGHFMNGYGVSLFPDGFYPQVNPVGFRPNTDALVVKTSVNF